jgi:hypothetical protein
MSLITAVGALVPTLIAAARPKEAAEEKIEALTKELEIAKAERDVHLTRVDSLVIQVETLQAQVTRLQAEREQLWAMSRHLSELDEQNGVTDPNHVHALCNCIPGRSDFFQGRASLRQQIAAVQVEAQQMLQARSRRGRPSEA